MVTTDPVFAMALGVAFVTIALFVLLFALSDYSYKRECQRQCQDWRLHEMLSEAVRFRDRVRAERARAAA